MVLIPYNHGWQGTIRGNYRGSPFCFTYFSTCRTLAMYGLLRRVDKFLAFIDEGL